MIFVCMASLGWSLMYSNDWAVTIPLRLRGLAKIIDIDKGIKLLTRILASRQVVGHHMYFRRLRS